LSVNLVVGLIVGMVWQFGHTSSYFHELWNSWMELICYSIFSFDWSCFLALI
jgi:hypothetical protein